MTHKRLGFTLVELTVSMAFLSLLTMNSIPALAKAREATRRTQCKNNLKQFGLAMHNYHDVFNSFPPGFVVRKWDSPAQQGFGWSYMLLPYLDQAPLYNSLRPEGQGLGEAADDPANLKAMKTPLTVARCPTDLLGPDNPYRGNWPTSNYSANAGSLPFPRLASGTVADYWPGHIAAIHPVGPKNSGPEQRFNGIFAVNSKVGIRDILDGTSNTILAAERGASSLAGIWLGVTSSTHENDALTEVSHMSRPNQSLTGYSSQHAGGFQMLLADGSVRFVQETISSAPLRNGKPQGVLQKLGCRNDGMTIGEF